MKKFILILVAFFCMALSVKSQDSLFVLTDTVLVTADRLKQHIFDINSSISLLSSKEIEIHSPRSTPEALISTPGVFVQKTNHGGGSPFLRGLTGQQSLILVDGIRLNNAITRSGPNQYFNTVDVQTLKRVEVLKGAGSVEYGSDAIGGTINLITDKPIYSFDNNFYFTPEIDVSYMSDDMEKSASAKLRGGNNSIAFLGTFSYADFGDIKAGEGTGVQSPNGYDQVSAAFDLMFRTTANSSLLISTQFLNQNEVPIFHKVDLEDYEYNYFDPQRRSLTYLRFSGVNPGIDMKNKLFSDYQLTAFYNMTEEGRSKKKNDSDIRTDETDKLTGYGFIAEAGSDLAKYWTMTTGTEFYHDKVNSSRIDFDLQANSQTDKRGLYPDNSTYWSLAFFNLHKLKFGKYIVDAGLRFNQYNIFVPEETLGDAEISPSALVWKAGISRKIGEIHALGINANKAFRAPNIDDMGTLGIVDFRYELPSDELKPESSINLELNYKLNLRRFWFEAAIFRNNLTDFIKRERATVDGRDSIDGYPIYLKKNSAEAYIQGFEANFKLLATDKLAVSGFLCYTYGQDETKDEPMRRIPPLNGMLSISYEAVDNLLIVPEFLFAAKQDRLAGGDIDDNRIPDGGTPGWNVFNIYAQYVWSGLKFHLGLINLLDEDYRYHGSGVNMYGRSARVGVSYIYGS